MRGRVPGAQGESVSSVLGSCCESPERTPEHPPPRPPMICLYSHAPCPREYQAWALHVPFSLVVLLDGEFGGEGMFPHALGKHGTWLL